MSDTYLTRESLIWRVKDKGDQEAWEEFTTIYQPFVKILIHKLSVSKTNVDDMTQEIMVELWKSVERFDIKGSAKFRSWLMSLVRNVAFQYMRKVYKRQHREDSYVSDNQIVAGSEFQDVDRFTEVYEKEWEAYVCSCALSSVKKKFVGNAVTVFELSLQGLETNEIADKLDIKQATVYQLRNRVKSALIKEIAQIRQRVGV